MGGGGDGAWEGGLMGLWVVVADVTVRVRRGVVVTDVTP